MKKEKDKLEKDKDKLLELIVKINKSKRAKIILLRKEIQILKRMAYRICDVSKEQLEEYSIKLNQLQDNLTTAE